MPIISFVCHKSYFYFIVFWALEISIDISKTKFENSFKNIGISTNLKNEYLNLISLNIADLLAGFLVLYTKYSLSNKNLKKKDSGNNIKYIYNDPTKKKCKFYLLIFISIMDFISRSVYFLFFLLIKDEKIFEKHQTDFLIALDIFTRYLFSRIILKTKIYRHHIWSIIISLLGFIIMSILDFITIIKNNNDVPLKLKIYYLSFIIVRSFLFPFEDVINQILLSDDYLLPHSLMWDRGVIEFPLSLIITIIVFYTKKINSNIFNSDYIFINILIRAGFIIILSIKAFCLMKTIFIFSSQYVSFLIVSESVAGAINLLIYGDHSIYERIYIFIDILSLIIIIFGTLMYNEMIIINICGCQEYTMNVLKIKAKNDFLSASIELIKDDGSDDEDNDINNDNIEDNANSNKKKN